nr:relaxin [Sus scrofa domesticus]
RMTLSEKCCQVGCIRKDIARLCESTNDFIKACGRELVRLWVEICGSVSTWGR